MKKRNKNSRKIKINIHLSNRWLYTLILIGVLIVAAVFVYAYGTSNPSVFGHSFSEIAPPDGCSDGQFVRWTGTGWDCVPSELAPPDGCIEGQFVRWTGTEWECATM